MTEIMKMSIPQIEYLLEGINNNNERQREAIEGGGSGEPQSVHEGQSALSFLMANQGTVEKGI